MSDIYSSSKRSQIMSGIKGKDTKYEILVRKYLYSKGFRYRKNDKRYPGKPDILIPKYKTAIFINGCFWHGHDCKYGTLPTSNTIFWKKKISDTKIRDNKKYSELAKLGFKVLIIWECELKKNFEECLSNVVKEILNSTYSKLTGP